MDVGACCPPRGVPLLGKPCIFSAPSGQGFLLLEVCALVKRVEKWQGCCSPTPGEGGMCREGLASQLAGRSIEKA